MELSDPSKPSGNLTPPPLPSTPTSINILPSHYSIYIENKCTVLKFFQSNLNFKFYHNKLYCAIGIVKPLSLIRYKRNCIAMNLHLNLVFKCKFILKIQKKSKFILFTEHTTLYICTTRVLRPLMLPFSCCALWNDSALSHAFLKFKFDFRFYLIKYPVHTLYKHFSFPKKAANTLNTDVFNLLSWL